MTDDQFLLASAYADDAVSADERARAEADPEVMAEVARIRAVRAELADVAPAPPSVRAAMIATAMQQFGAGDAAEPSPAAATHHTPAPIEPLRRHRPAPARRGFASQRYLGVAAAVVAVVAVGGVVASNLPRSTDDDTSTPLSAEFTEADRPAEFDATMAATVAPAAEDTQLDLPPAAAPEAGGAEELTIASAGPSDAPAATARGATVIESADQLRELGLALRDGELHVNATAPASTAPDTGEQLAPCTFADALATPATDAAVAAAARQVGAEPDDPVVMLGEADYRRSPDETLLVLVAVDLDTAQTYAIEPTACTLVAVGTAP